MSSRGSEQPAWLDDKDRIALQAMTIIIIIIIIVVVVVVVVCPTFSRSPVRFGLPICSGIRFFHFEMCIADRKATTCM